MAHEHDSKTEEGTEPSRGLAVVISDPVQNPGLPPHRDRITDVDEKANKRAARTVYLLFYFSAAASIWAVVAYIIFPIESQEMSAIRASNLWIGLGIGAALLAIGVGAIHWSKTLMSGHEHVEERHPIRGTDETRAGAIDVFEKANEESGFGRRKMIRNSLFVAVGASILPGLTLFRNLAPNDGRDPVELLNETAWEEGTHLVLDPEGTRVRAADVTLGSAFHIIPENILDLPHDGGYLEAKAKAIVLLVRMRPEQLTEADDRKDWSYDGIVAYSKVCTHVGCPVALYEQHTHHLLCPCHQSQFDVSDHAKVVFGPASRPLPQLPITVDAEGYLIARHDFTEAVGPSFWERH